MDETISRISIEIGASSDDAVRQLDQAADSLKNMKAHAKQTIRVDSKDVDKAVKKVNALSKVLSAMKRIAFYRVIRSAIKAVGEAFSEGAENAYWYSKTMGDSTKYIADAYDRLSSGSFKMSNQLGAAWATLKATLEPILISIINLVTRAASAITQLFAVLGGRSTYLKAIDYSKDWADATAKGAGAAKEWKNQLMGFDEINRLEEPSKGGGGGGAPGLDYENMFDDAQLSDWAIGIKDMISNGDWKGVGAALAERLNSAIGSIDFYEIGSKFAEKLTIIPDVLINFFLTFDTVAAANALINFVSGVFDGLSSWLETYDWSQVGDQIYKKLNAEIEGIDFGKIASSFFGLLGRAFGAAVSFLGGFFSGVWEGVKGYFDRKTEEAGGNVVLGFLNGILDGMKHILEWIRDNVLTPFIEGWRSTFGIHSPSTVMEEIGGYIVDGFWKGIEEKWEKFIGFFEGLWDDLKSWWDGLSLGAFHIPVPHFDWTYSEASGVIARALEFVGLPATIPHLNISWYAQGGFPEDGLFMANHGELVGQFSNGRTAVANNEQITEGIARAVYEAFIEAFTQTNGSNGNGQPVEIYLDGRQIAATTTRYQRQFARANG